MADKSCGDCGMCCKLPAIAEMARRSCTTFRRACGCGVCETRQVAFAITGSHLEAPATP